MEEDALYYGRKKGNGCSFQGPVGVRGCSRRGGLTPPTEDRVGLLWGMRSQAPDRLQKLFLGAGINHYQG